MSESFDVPRRGWTKRTTIIRLNPESLRRFVLSEALVSPRMADHVDRLVRDGMSGRTAHGYVRWIPDPSVAEGTSEQMEVYE